MFKTVIKPIDLNGLNYDETSYAEFRDNIGWHESYTNTLINEGYKADYVAIHNDKVISYKYSSILWLMALRLLYEKFIDDDINETPVGVMIQSINSDIASNIRSNQKWIIPVTCIFKCEKCKELFDGNCSCIQ